MARMTKTRALPIAVIIMGVTFAAIGPANAALIIQPGTSAGGVQAQAETPLNGGPGFPCTSCTANPVTTYGYTNPAQLVPDTTGNYVFTFMGAGDAGATNNFALGSNTFTAYPPGATGPGSTADGTSFLVSLTAGTPIDFSFGSTTGCNISAGGSGSPGCGYLIGLADSPSAPGALGPQSTAWLGFSDGATTTDADFQDMVVRVTVPDPATVALVGIGLLALFGIQRTRKVSKSFA